MHIQRSGVMAAAFAAVLLAGCGSTAGGSSADPPAASTTSAASSPASSNGSGTLAVADSSLGKIIVDGQGKTAYYFTKDEAGSGKSVCSGDCLVAWPAIAASADAPTGTGITAELGSITRDDGTKQVTVDGRPVYLFDKDTAPGDVTGQGVGKVWYVMGPDGTMITDNA